MLPDPSGLDYAYLGAPACSVEATALGGASLDISYLGSPFGLGGASGLIAYQTALFAYQGVGQFVYQEVGVPPAPPRRFGRHPPRGLSRRELQNLEAKWLDRNWLRHPTIEVPEATPLPVPIAPPVYEAWGLSLLGLASDAEVSYSLSAEPQTLLGIATDHELGLEIAPQGTDHEVNLVTTNVGIAVTVSGSPNSALGLTTRSEVTKDLYLDRPFSAEELAAVLSRVRPKNKK